MKTFSSIEILDRLKEMCEIQSDTALADMLGISKATISNWRARNSIDYGLIFSKCEHLDVNNLLRGEPSIVQNNESGHNINGKNVSITDNGKLIDIIKSQTEQIDRLIGIIEKLK